MKKKMHKFKMTNNASANNNKTGNSSNNRTVRISLTRSIYTPVKRVHDLTREEGINPPSKKTHMKYLAFAKILIKDAATALAASTKQNKAFMKLGRFASQRGRTYTSKYANARTLNMLHKRKARLREQHLKHFLIRSDNARPTVRQL